MCVNTVFDVPMQHILSLSVRQVQRLVTRFRESGAAGLVHQRRGKPSSNKINDNVRYRCLSLINKKYPDFGPTLAHEKLTERHDISISLETLRQWMIADGLWVPHAKLKPRVYQPRHRRDCLGELVQIDGSHHDWFEGRSPKCCLLVYIDDATGRLMNLRFSETESAFDYMVATCKHLVLHDKPTVIHSERHTVFHVSKHVAQIELSFNDLSMA